MKNTTTSSTISWGQLFLLVGVMALFLFALTARVTFEPKFEAPAVVYSDYVFKGSTIATYTGSDKEVTLPSSYSIGGVSSQKTGTIVLNSTSEAFDFLQQEYTIGAVEYYDFYNQIYSQTYPWIHEYSISVPIYVEGNDIQITGMEWSCFQNNREIEKVYIPAALKEIGVHTFRDCINLKEVIIEEGFEKIGDSAFWGCSSLKTIVLPSTIKQIDAYAFFRSGIETINLPKKLERLHIGTFYDCANLKTVKIESEKLIRANHNDYYGHFGNCSNLETIFVPNELLEDYKTTMPWSLYEEFMVNY